VPLAEVRTTLEREGFSLSPDPRRGWGPARHMRARDAAGREGLVGFIGAMTENFCEDCNRARIAADGGFQACLGGADRANLRDLLRAGAGDEAVEAAVRGALFRKAPRHRMDEAGAVSSPDDCRCAPPCDPLQPHHRVLRSRVPTLGHRPPAVGGAQQVAIELAAQDVAAIMQVGLRSAISAIPRAQRMPICRRKPTWS
jgi:hypothetical protein